VKADALVILAVALFLFLICLNAWREDRAFHYGMTVEMNIRKTFLSIERMRDDPHPRMIKLSVHKDIIETDQAIVLEASTKPFLATFTDDELKAIDAAKADLAKDK
jgi:hypothetical protein